VNPTVHITWKEWKKVAVRKETNLVVRIARANASCRAGLPEPRVDNPRTGPYLRQVTGRLITIIGLAAGAPTGDAYHSVTVMLLPHELFLLRARRPLDGGAADAV
jgi:hypothetical protein